MAARPLKNFKVVESDTPLLASMSDDQRYLLTSKDNHKQMMAHMDCAAGTIKSRLHRARKALMAKREAEANKVASKET